MPVWLVYVDEVIVTEKDLLSIILYLIKVFDQIKGTTLKRKSKKCSLFANQVNSSLSWTRCLRGRYSNTPK